MGRRRSLHARQGTDIAERHDEKIPEAFASFTASAVPFDWRPDENLLAILIARFSISMRDWKAELS